MYVRLCVVWSLPSHFMPMGQTFSMSSNRERIVRTAAAATAISVAALALTIPAPTHARPMFPLAPGCDNWEIGPTAYAIEVEHADMPLVEFYGWSGKSLTATPGGRPAFAEYYTTSPPTYGSASGGINGRSIDMAVLWNKGPGAGSPPVTFKGQIDDTGVASGTATIFPGIVGLEYTRGWRSHDRARCATVSPPPPPAPPPPAPPAPSEITLRYGEATIFSVTAFVGITNNENKPPVNCSYSDGVSPPRPFTVTGAAETRIDISGLATGTVFHVTVTCDNGLTHSADQKF